MDKHTFILTTNNAKEGDYLFALGSCLIDQLPNANVTSEHKRTKRLVIQFTPDIGLYQGETYKGIRLL